MSWDKKVYDSKGNQLSYEDDSGYWWEATYDTDNWELTYQSSAFKGTVDGRGNHIGKKRDQRITGKEFR